MPRTFKTEAVVLPRRVLWYGGEVYGAGSRLALPDEDFDTLQADGIVDVAKPANLAAVDEALLRSLPVPHYVSAGDDDPAADPADPRDVKRRARRAAAPSKREP
jgi:hypothetical protein